MLLAVELGEDVAVDVGCGTELAVGVAVAPDGS